MSGGAGHVADMNNRLKQNRSIQTSINKNYHKKSSFNTGNKSQKLKFKEVSKDQLAQIKEEIRKKGRIQRKKERILYGIIITAIVITLTWIFK